MNTGFAGDDDTDEPRVSRARTKVLHIITGDLFAGAERVQELLAERLPEFGYEASFVCLKRGRFQEQLEAGTREVVTIPMRSRFDLIHTSLRIAERARLTGCRIIHTHTSRGALIGCLTAVAARLPLVHHMHCPSVRNTANPWLDGLNTVIERVSLLRARAIIPVSASVARYVAEQGHSRRRIFTVPNGVSVSSLGNRPSPHQELQLVMVALFRPRKGIEILLRAMQRMLERGQQVRLRAVGAFESSDYEKQILVLAEALGLSPYIEWRGFQSDVVDELTGMDVLVLPSLFGEGMPMVVLEAMAVGLPIVASRVEGVPEAVRDGEEGLLVPPGDVDALASALARMLTDRPAAEYMGNAARRRQCAMFSDLAMARGVCKVYDRLLGKVPESVPMEAATL